MAPDIELFVPTKGSVKKFKVTGNLNVAMTDGEGSESDTIEGQPEAIKKIEAEMIEAMTTHNAVNLIVAMRPDAEGTVSQDGAPLASGFRTEPTTPTELFKK